MLAGRRAKNPCEIPTSSMADIAFLLLIFFLVTTTINTDKGLAMFLPKWGDQLDVPKDNILNVLINPSGQVMVDEIETPITLLKENIQKRIEANENLIISIKPSSATEYNVFITVLDQCKMAGAKKISIAELDG